MNEHFEWNSQTPRLTSVSGSVFSEIDGMRTGSVQPSTQPVMIGTALALALAAYGILANRQARAYAVARQQSPAGSSTKPHWRRLFRRVARDISQKNLTIIAAGTAFNAFLAVPATLAVLASLSLLIFNPIAIQRSVRPVEHLVPSYVMRLLSSPHSLKTLGIGLLVSVAIDLWTVLSGSSCMITAVSLIYGEKSKRAFIKRLLAVLILSALTAPFVLVSLLLILVLPSVLDVVPLGPLAETAILVGRWPILMGLFVTVRAVSQRYATHPLERRWRWTSWGGLVAVVLWISGSIVLSAFVTEFVPSDQTYGTLGSIIGVLVWLNFTALVVLLGAQIDAEIEQDRDIGSPGSSKRVSDRAAL